VGDAEVAYQVIGEGPTDLLFFWGLGTQIDLRWQHQPTAAFLTRLASFSRVIVFDRRGTGASDPWLGSAFPTWEDWTEDVRSVLDAAGSERAAICAVLDSGPMAILAAAMWPQRVSALVLINTSARYLVADDYPIGASADTVHALVEYIANSWGTPEAVGDSAPSIANDPGTVRRFAEQYRAAATPRTAATQFRYIMESLDVRPALPLIQNPTLVLHYSRNPLVSIEHGRYLVKAISGATLVELSDPGFGVSPDTESYGVVANEIEAFVTGEHPPVPIERLLTTVLFTDIVSSTNAAARLGDSQWVSVLDAHDVVMDRELGRFRGRKVDVTGDGLLAIFDGPARAIRRAQAMGHSVRPLGIEVRAGLHTGEVEMRGDNIGGIGVHIGARIAVLAGAGEVLVSRTVTDLVVGSGIKFADRGEHGLKGVPGLWRLFALADRPRSDSGSADRSIAP
jgi:class 3 adenylate cyclase